MDDKPRRFVVGYALLPKKQASFIQKSLVDQAGERGIDLVPVDPNKPLVDQGPFDCILHKLYGEDWESQLHEFSVRFPTAPIIDPPVAIERLHNRISMLQVVADVKIKEENETFGIPKQTVIYDAETLGSLTGLEFPVIAKPLVADGSAKSHKMSLIFNSTGLSKLKPPIVLQEFVNHGGVIFKVYVAGEYVRCVKRRSLPDVSQEKMLSSVGSMSFSQISNMAQNHTQEYYESTELKSSEMPPLSFLTEIARELRKAMGLNLFNFDVIRDVKIGTRYLVIDINYFPGYAKMPGYEEVLTDFFWDLFHPKPKGDPSEEDGSTSMKTIGNGTS